MMKTLKTLHDLYNSCKESGVSIIPFTELQRIEFRDGEDDYRYSSARCESIEVKPRLSKAEYFDDNWRLYIGRVCYKHIVEDRQKYYENSGIEVLQRLKRGCYEHNPFKYLASSIGVTALLETMDSKFVLGRRNDNAMHPNDILLHGVSGYCESNRDSIFKLKPFGDIERELEEEVGITPNLISNIALLGLCFHEMKIGANFIFWVKVKVDSSYFGKGGLWQQAVDAKEHKMFEVFEGEKLTEIIAKDYLHYSSMGAISRWLQMNNNYSRGEV